MASLEDSVVGGGYSLFDGEPPIDISWILKLTDDDDGPGTTNKLSASSSPEPTTSSGYGSSQGEDQGRISTTPPIMGSEMTFNPWAIPCNPNSNYNCWAPIPTPPSTPAWASPSQSVSQAQEPILLWSQQGMGNNGWRSIRQMIPLPIPPPILERHPPQIISLEANGDKYWGIAVDKCTDRLYVTDRGGSEVILLDPSVGKPILRFGQDKDNVLRSSGNQLFRPTGLVVDKIHRRLLICDKDNHRICIYTLDGQFISSFGTKGHGPGDFNYPWDIDISPNGNLIIVSDSRNHRIQIFDRFGNYMKRFTVFESDPFEYKNYFDYPRGITFDNEGKMIYCTDFNTNNLVSLDVETLDFKIIVQYGKLNRPHGVTVNEDGNLLVCDSRRNCVRVISPQGSLVNTLNRVEGTVVTAPVDSCILGGGQVATLGITGNIYLF